MKKIHFIRPSILAGLTAMIILPVFANQDGTSTAQFLKIGRGVRAEGMGGAFTSVANDSRAVLWNPAGLAQQVRTEFAFDHLEYIENMKVESVGAAIPVNKLNGTFGFDATYLNMGTIDRMDNTGTASSGENKVSAYSGTLSYGQALGNRLAVGGGAKFLKQDLAGTTGSGFAADLGLMYAIILDRLNLGASVLNLGPKVKTGSTDESLPLSYRGGLAYYFIPEQFVLSADVVKEKDSDMKYNVGTEYIYQQSFVVRAGYQDTKEAGGGLSAGGGFIWHPQSKESGEFMGSHPTNRFNERGMEVRFDYAYVDLGIFKATHRFGITISY